MASAQPPTPSCLLDRIGSSVTIDSIVRAMAMLWAVPASLLIVSGYRFVFDRPPAALVATYIDVSRALVPLLAAFTMVVAAIWLVRSGRVMVAELDMPVRFRWSAHVWSGMVAVAALGGSIVMQASAFSPSLPVVAAVFGFVAGMGVPRRLLSIADPHDRALRGWAVLVSVMVFELTVGWLHSMTLVDGASIVSGLVVSARGLVMCGAVATVGVWAKNPQRSSAVTTVNVR